MYINIQPQIYRYQTPNNDSISFKSGPADTTLPVNQSKEDQIAELAFKYGGLTESGINNFLDEICSFGRLKRDKVFELITAFSNRIAEYQKSVKQREEAVQNREQEAQKREEATNRRNAELDKRNSELDESKRELEKKSTVLSQYRDNLESIEQHIINNTRNEETERILAEERQKAKDAMETEYAPKQAQLEKDQAQLLADQEALAIDRANFEKEKDEYPQFLADTRAEITEQVKKDHEAREKAIASKEKNFKTLLAKGINDSAAQLRMQYEITPKYADLQIIENYGEQMTQVGKLINDHDENLSDTTSSFIEDLVDVLQNDDGNIPVESLNFLQDILEVNQRYVYMFDLINLIALCKNDSGDIDPAKSGYALTTYAWKDNSLKDTIALLIKRFNMIPIPENNHIVQTILKNAKEIGKGGHCENDYWDLLRPITKTKDLFKYFPKTILTDIRNTLSKFKTKNEDWLTDNNSTEDITKVIEEMTIIIGDDIN